MMELDRHRALSKRMSRQAAKRERPKNMRKHLEWVCHAQDCKRCKTLLAHLYVRHEVFMSRMNPQTELDEAGVKNATTELFTSLGCKTPGGL
jgi:hypothetical protein